MMMGIDCGINYFESFVFLCIYCVMMQILSDRFCLN